MNDVRETATQLRRASTRLALRMRVERPADGTSGAGLTVLGLLHLRGQLTATELAAAERVQPQSLTRVLATLDQNGLISRSPDTRDRRRQTIDLTERGLQVLIEHVRQSDDWLTRAMTERLTPTELDVLRLAANLIEQLLQET
ncbi:MarR family winged helix-turn-helix transcriptional regulator [Kribbella sp. C-35]|uniref:MarR family winged helix-turn-helix transcriptional regulator n=1 Tax=Kribbella sp. C-35 TaxID=2789276 RepID=UPI00397C4D6C